MKTCKYCKYGMTQPLCFHALREPFPGLDRKVSWSMLNVLASQGLGCGPPMRSVTLPLALRSLHTLRQDLRSVDGGREKTFGQSWRPAQARDSERRGPIAPLRYNVYTQVLALIVSLAFRALNTIPGRTQVALESWICSSFPMHTDRKQGV